MLQNIILLIAITTVTAHSILPHFHHDETQTITGLNRAHDEQLVALGQHEHDEDDHHSIFSFVQLDENFFPANTQSKKIAPHLTFLIALVVTHQPVDFPVKAAAWSGDQNAFPLFDSHFPPPSHRGPPTV